MNLISVTITNPVVVILIKNLLSKHLYIQYTREKLQMAGLMSADQNFIPLSAPTLLTLFFVQYCTKYAQH